MFQISHSPHHPAPNLGEDKVTEKRRKIASKLEMKQREVQALPSNISPDVRTQTEDHIEELRGEAKALDGMLRAFPRK